jgi:hypothetical protein
MYTRFRWRNLMNKTLERPRRRWEDNIKTDLQYVGCGDVEWIEVAQKRDILQARLNGVINSSVP